MCFSEIARANDAARQAGGAVPIGECGRRVRRVFFSGAALAARVCFYVRFGQRRFVSRTNVRREAKCVGRWAIVMRMNRFISGRLRTAMVDMYSMNSVGHFGFAAVACGDQPVVPALI
ncbi:hypothetical protein QZM46_08845 [Burkholderia vietnamiensis]|uniref:Uncharacterized protein n=1 Tax=Burkholderia vietnamiensis TaxID=60552 RepID=A0AAW7TDH9_BURVI|nr:MULTISPECIES: hypothetical protein [Burkholderia]MBR8010288.1 hypothetical protein [Burkholderia vietnamiensis]MBR8014695.1 hypothetical protein [Burkholderia vietnamiensis]MBR8193974.1 hypothetical protein [Burkholderia vietnamiensis]MBU9354498.1 hypothetical protein [Burkholderia multivorans]MBU9492537.1 hypothetical protein [Burkholderia multivorans]